MTKIITNESMMETVTTILEDFSGYVDCISGMTIPVVYNCDAEKRTMEFVYHTSPWMQNTNGVVHGGITATMLDISMGLITMCMYGGTTLTPTVNMQISYLLPIPTDEDMLVRVHISHTGKNIAHVTAEMSRMDSDELYATSTGIYYILG